MSVERPYDSESFRLASTALQDRRSEINERSRAQHTIIQITVTVLGVVLGFVLAQEAARRVLLVLPLVSVPLGLLYLDHGVNIAHIGAFIRTNIVPVLAAVPGGRAVLEYEEFVGAFEQRWMLRFFLFGGPLLLLFAGAPAGALIYLRWAGLVTTWPMTLLWFGGALLVVWYLLFWLWWTFVFPGSLRRG